MNFELLKKKALEKGIKEIEVYSSKSDSTDLNFFDGEVDGNNTEQADVCCVRGVYNNQIATVYTEKTTDDAIDFIITSIITDATIIDKEEPFFIYPGDKDYPTVEKREYDFESYTIADKIALCKKLDQMLKAKSPYVFKTESSYSEYEKTITIKNSNGLDVTNTNKKAYIVCELFAKSGDDVRVSYDYLFLENLMQADLDKFADKLIDDAVSQFGAKSIPSGEYDIVLDKDCVRSLLQAYNPIFRATSVIKRMSFLAGKIEDKIFGDNITLIDDPLNNASTTVHTFDDEGVATKTKTIVDNGVLKTYLHNLSTAKMMNTESTGNGFKAGVSSPVGVDSDNFYLVPDKYSVEELYASVGNGLLITDLSGLHAGVNIISGAFSLQASGFKIENGKKTEPVTLIILSSSIQYVLNNVKMIGNDFEFRNGYGSSSIVISKMPISGN